MIKRITKRFTPETIFSRIITWIDRTLGLYLIVVWSSYTPLDNLGRRQVFNLKPLIKPVLWCLVN